MAGRGWSSVRVGRSLSPVSRWWSSSLTAGGLWYGQERELDLASASQVDDGAGTADGTGTAGAGDQGIDWSATPAPGASDDGESLGVTVDDGSADPGTDDGAASPSPSRGSRRDPAHCHAAADADLQRRLRPAGRRTAVGAPGPHRHGAAVA